jgi:hypothetical protein
MNKIVLTLLILLAGCANAKEMKGPNGETAYQVKCGNAVKEKCSEKATQLCPKGYTKLNRNSDRYDDSTKVGNLGLLEIKTDTTTTLLITCNQ